MKIVHNPIYVPNGTRTARFKAPAAPGFQDVLDRAMERPNTTADAPAAAASARPAQSAQMAETSRATQAASLTAPAMAPRELVRRADPAAEERLLNDIEGLLDQVEAYASQLEKNPNLKPAYAALENIAQAVDKLRKSAPQAVAQNPELESLVQELDVLAVTEFFKFNRGDYSPTGPNSSSAE